MSNPATLQCPKCGTAEYPVRHNVQSNCDGRISWQWGSLKCERCGMGISILRCDNCGARLGKDCVS